jgi:cysteine desulfurase
MFTCLRRSFLINTTNRSTTIKNTIYLPYKTTPLQKRFVYEYKGVKLEGRSIYLDAQATTCVDPRVLDAMLPYMTEQYGNPHSTTHLYGWENAAAVERAREQVAKLINADPKEIIFTSGATESNNIAIKGTARFYKAKKNHVITCVMEHKCVLDSCRKIEDEGFKVTYLPVNKNGILDLNHFEEILKQNKNSTIMVSVMFVNNEIGVIQPIAEIGALCRKYDVFFHTDAAQALGKVPIDVNAMNIDLMSLSGHKIYGPKGVGAIYLRRRPRVRVEPIQSGGGQERGIRSGTVPTSLVVGFGKACEVAMKEMENDAAHAKKLWNRLYNNITSRLDFVYLNGDPDKRWHGNLNISFAYVEGESLLLGLREVACSSGSACTSASLEPSYVLRALGVDEELAHTSIRFGIGRFTTEEEVDFAADQVVDNVTRLREMSPLYDMVKDGVDLKTIQWSQEH